MAEPVMAVPRAPTIAGTRLEVSDRQIAQVEILERMLADEKRQLPTASRLRASNPLLRWVVAVLMFAAVIIPALFNVPQLAAPSRWPVELEPLLTMIENLPTNRPVLVVFDYEAGFAGEMEAVASPFLEHLLLRGMHVAAISTTSSGPMLVEHIFDGLRQARPVEVAKQTTNMGYLPGGANAMRLFATAPRETALSGFALPQELSSGSIWDIPSLAEITRLSDFGLMAVITSGAENGRNWAEQLNDNMGASPLIMITSAGTGPVLRPYYEGVGSQIDGMLYGLPAAVSYEQALSRPGTATTRWAAFGMGTWMAFLLLAIAVLYGLVLRIAQTPTEDDEHD